MGISLIDEADVDKHGAPAEIAEEDFEPVEADIPIEPVVIEEEPVIIEEDKIIEKEIVESEPGRRIDDPVRTYLTQMGEIPLLNRENEISLARKIEVSRMTFRRKMLENDYCAKNSVEILQQVQQGGLILRPDDENQHCRKPHPQRHQKTPASEPYHYQCAARDEPGPFQGISPAWRLPKNRSCSSPTHPEPQAYRHAPRRAELANKQDCPDEGKTSRNVDEDAPVAEQSSPPASRRITSRKTSTR